MTAMVEACISVAARRQSSASIVSAGLSPSPNAVGTQWTIYREVQRPVFYLAGMNRERKHSGREISQAIGGGPGGWVDVADRANRLLRSWRALVWRGFRAKRRDMLSGSSGIC